jgi:hypothetical protein
MLAHGSRAYRSKNRFACCLTRSLALFLGEWTQIVDHGNPRYTDIHKLASSHKDFGQNEAIFLGIAHKHGAVNEGYKPVVPD